MHATSNEDHGRVAQLQAMHATDASGTNVVAELRQTKDLSGICP
jgi:hypothetical protein